MSTCYITLRQQLIDSSYDPVLAFFPYDDHTSFNVTQILKAHSQV